MKNNILLMCAMFMCTQGACSETVDIIFHDSVGNLYRTTDISADFESAYNQKFEIEKTLLVETVSLQSPDFIIQDQSLNSINDEFEELKLIVIISCPQMEYKNGFHTTRVVAKALLADKIHKIHFRLRLLDSSGAVLKEIYHPLSGEDLLKWLK